MIVSTATEVKTKIIELLNQEINNYSKNICHYLNQDFPNYSKCYELSIGIFNMKRIRELINDIHIKDYVRQDVKNLITKLNTFIEQTEILEEIDDEQ